MEKHRPHITEKIRAYSRLVLRYLQLVGRRFMDDGCQHSAAALTYMTLFAVVPMMTVTFSMFSLVPAFQGIGNQVQELIFSNFLPSAGAEVETYLADFSSQARTLSVVGVVILVVTSYLMLHNIERVFNRIWATTGPRRGVMAFLLYWAVLSLGPLLIGTAMLMNTYLLSIRMFTDELAQDALNIVFGYLPWLLTVVAFTLLYTVVPNCKVMLRNALTGGIVATLALELAKAGFGYFVANSSYTSIYGAFAVVPIFLLWVYLCWMIVLGGAEFVRATENFGAEIRGQLPVHASAIFSLWLLWRAHKEGRELTEIECRKAGLSTDGWREIRDQLLANKIISVTENRNFILLKSLDDITLWDILQLYPRALKIPTKEPLGLDEDNSEGAKWWQAYLGILEENEVKSEKLMSVTLAELFNQKKSLSYIDGKTEEKQISIG